MALKSTEHTESLWSVRLEHSWSVSRRFCTVAQTSDNLKDPASPPAAAQHQRASSQDQRLQLPNGLKHTHTHTGLKVCRCALKGGGERICILPNCRHSFIMKLAKELFQQLLPVTDTNEIHLLKLKLSFVKWAKPSCPPPPPQDSRTAPTSSPQSKCLICTRCGQ